MNIHVSLAWPIKIMEMCCLSQNGVNIDDFVTSSLKNISRKSKYIDMPMQNCWIIFLLTFSLPENMGIFTYVYKKNCVDVLFMAISN